MLEKSQIVHPLSISYLFKCCSSYYKESEALWSRDYSKFNVHLEHLGNLLNDIDSNSVGLGGALDSAFLAGFQVMPLLLVEGLHFPLRAATLSVS